MMECAGFCRYAYVLRPVCVSICVSICVRISFDLRLRIAFALRVYVVDIYGYCILVIWRMYFYVVVVEILL